ncbi:MAG: hypothetical protein LV481_04975 [Methylacidiphilales bacterium]|nr:hypothetical protein [Candidatus Methylacidiphilales bacterium]
MTPKKKIGDENRKLSALQKREKPTVLNLACYRFDLNRVMDIIAAAANLGVTLNQNQAIRYAIRNCPIIELTTSDFTEILNEENRRGTK